MLRAFLFCFFVPAALIVGQPFYFAPAHQLTGIGAGRAEMSAELVAERARLMIEAQTFFFLREPQAVTGAERIEKYSPIFEEASRQSGLPSSLIKAIGYLESFGDPLATSYAGCCRGIMQVSNATAIDMGLRMVYATKYRIVTERRASKNKKGKTVYTTVKRKVPYQVLVEDERLVPEKAIPKAANYLARLSQEYGGTDWAIFAYHCGVGCVGNMRNITQRAKGMEPFTVARMFFGNSPSYNKELYEEIRRQMERDWSPTYWFRVMRAEQLLKMYREDRDTFLELASYYRYAADPSTRPQHRLAVWLRSEDFLYQSPEDLKRDEGKRLAKVVDDPDYFGFRINKDAIGGDSYLQATPAALGTLTYIAYETRRLHEAMRPKGEKWVPLEVVSLVRATGAKSDVPGEALAHCSGHVFDIRYAGLPPGEREALQFVLDDMGYEGYLGFIDETANSGVMHIGCSPSSREFFAKVFEDALGAKRST
jgi:hypothetical protein